MINTIVNGEQFNIEDEVWANMSAKEKSRFSVVSGEPAEVTAMAKKVIADTGITEIKKKNESTKS